MLPDYSERNADKFFNSDLPQLVTSQRQYELDELIKIYKAIKPYNVLEIGSQEGGTLYHWLINAEPGATVVAVDMFQNMTKDQQASLKTMWLTWAQPETKFYFYDNDSHSSMAYHYIHSMFPNGLDFLFIDGDHTYEGARQDFANYAPMVRPGGVIAFHDLMTPKSGLQNHIQVGKLWQEIQHFGHVTREIWCHPHQDWGGIGVVYV